MRLYQMLAESQIVYVFELLGKRALTYICAILIKQW